MYILALVALDWIIVTLVLIPYTLVAYGGFSDEVNVYLHFVSTVTFNNGFGLYLFPSLFLALDRVFVIRFPLTFRDYEQKLRIFKSIVVLVRITLGILDCFYDLVYGLFSFGSYAVKMITLFIMILVLLTISVLYTVMVVQIIWSSKKMSNSRQMAVHGG